MKKGTPITALTHHRDVPYTRILVWFRGGSSVETEEELGWAHLIEHLLFKSRHAGKTIAEFIEGRGGQTNAFTSHDAVVVEATVRNEDAGPTLDFLAAVLSAPLTAIATRDLEEERAVVLEELRLYDDEPSERLFIATMQGLYPGHPYGREIIGTEGALRAATLPKLERFLRTKLSHAPFVTVAGGHTGEVRFRLPQCPPPPPPVIGRRHTERRFFLRHGQHKNYLLAAWRIDDRDPARLAAARLLHTIAYDMEGSRFRDRLVYETNTFDSFSMSIINGLAGLSFLQSAVFEPARTYPRLKRWMKGWEGFAVTQEEVARAREVILSEECFSAEGVGNTAEIMGTSYLAAGDPYRLERDLFWHLAHLTAGDINAFKRDLLSFDTAVIGLATPPRCPSCAMPGRLPEREASPERTDGTAPALIEHPRARILYRHAGQAPFVSLYALKRSGVLADPQGRGGTLRLMLETLTTTAEGMTRERTDAFLDRFGISLEPVFGNNTGGLRLTVRDTFLPEAIDILGRILRSPLRRDDFEREKEHTLARLSLKRESPAALLKEKIHELLFAGTAYDHQAEGTADSVAATTFADVRAVRRAFLSRGRWSLGVSGAVDERFARQIAALLPRGGGEPYAGTTHTTVRLDDRVETVTVPGRNQRHIIRLFRAPGVRSRDFETMRFIEQALMGQKSPYFQLLREEEGLVYALDVWGMGGLREGYVALYAVTSPEKCATVMRRIERTVAKFRKGDVDPAYLDEVKSALRFEHARSSVRNEFHAFNLALEDALGLPFGAYLRQPETFAAVTRDDIVSCAGVYFGKGLWIVSGESDEKG